MDKSLSLETQRRLHALYRYVKAMETGDLENIARLLHAAEQDAVLDRMFQEIDMHYQDQDQMLLQSHELATVEQQIAQLSMQEIERVQTWQSSQQTPLQRTPHVFPLPQERRQTAMHYKPVTFDPAQETRGIPQVQQNQQKPGKKRSARFLQTLAAVLLVVALLGGFLALYARLTSHPQSLGVAVQPTAQVQPPGTIIGISDVTTFGHSVSDATENIRAYKLHSASNTPTWSTLLMVHADKNEAPGARPASIVVQNQIAYIRILSVVFALRVDTGHLLWQKTLPFDPQSRQTLQIAGDILIVGGYDANVVGSIYRLNEQNGSFLWHYQTDNAYEPAFAVSNGVVYVGKDEVNSMYTPNPGTLRFLVALNGINGNVLWSRDNINPLGITVKNGTLYVQSIAADNTGNDKHYFLSAWTSSGHRLWSVTGPAQVPIVSDSGLLIIESGNDLCAYQAANGHNAWCTHNPTTTIMVSGMKMTEGVFYNDYEVQNGVLYSAYTMQTAGTSTHQSTAAFLEARNIQSGAVIWSHKVGTTDTDITHKGTQTIMNAPKDVGLNLGMSGPLLLSQNTLSITAGTSIFTFSLADGHQLWQANIKVPGNSANFVGSVYVAP